MDDLPTQPVCPSDGITMRDHPDGYACPECGLMERVEPVAMPPEFDGPSVHGG